MTCYVNDVLSVLIGTNAGITPALKQASNAGAADLLLLLGLLILKHVKTRCATARTVCYTQEHVGLSHCCCCCNKYQ